MAISQNYGLVWMGFSEEIITGISKYKHVKNVQECPSKLLQDPGMLGFE